MYCLARLLCAVCCAELGAAAHRMSPSLARLRHLLCRVACVLHKHKQGCLAVQSEYASLFIDWHKFWDGEPSEEDVNRIYSRKPDAPTREIEHADGTKRTVWCTFSEEQIDMDVYSEAGDRFIGDQIQSLAERCAFWRALVLCL